MSRSRLMTALFLVFTYTACGGGDGQLAPSGTLSQETSSATAGKLNTDRATVTIPVAEIGGGPSEDCSINIAVNNTARHTDLSCDTYYIDAAENIIFVLPSLSNGDVIEIVIVNNDSTYIYTATVSDAAETTASLSSQDNSDSGSESGTDEDDPYYSPDGDDVDYVTVSAIDENGSATVMFPYDVIWDNADADDEVAVVTSQCSDDVEYHFFYADLLALKDSDGNVSVSFTGCDKDDSIYYFFVLAKEIYEDRFVDLSLDESQEVEIPEITHISESYD